MVTFRRQGIAWNNYDRTDMRFLATMSQLQERWFWLIDTPIPAPTMRMAYDIVYCVDLKLDYEILRYI